MKEDKGNLPMVRSIDLANAEVALRRSAIKAREIARKTSTSVVYSINGKIVRENPADDQPARAR